MLASVFADLASNLLIHAVTNPEVFVGLIVIAYLAFTGHLRARAAGDTAALAREQALEARVQDIVHRVALAVASAKASGLIPAGLSPVAIGVQKLDETLQTQGLTMTSEVEALFRLVWGQVSGELEHVGVPVTKSVAVEVAKADPPKPVAG